MALTAVHEFDAFYVISDLHIGGLPGLQIFQQSTLLASFIDSLIDPGNQSKIGLCINGDTVDFLAEPGATYFDPFGANAKLDRMFADAGFNPVWEALRRFVKQSNRRLILTLGNHDLELALPWVQEHLLQSLAQGHDEARGRVTFSFQGMGYRCDVGGKSVLCLHGNEFDPWNLTDYEKLRRIGRDITQGRSVESWIPNAGTRLVVDVMNEIKRQYSFVDVLKPEVEAVLPILWVLGEATRQRLSRVFSVSKRLTWDSVRHTFGFLAPGEKPSTVETPVFAEDADSTAYQPRFDLGEPDTDRMLDWAEEQLEAGTEPLALARSSADQLGMPGAIWDRMRGRSQHVQAWEALKELAGDRTFDIRNVDSVYERADKFVDQCVDYLITGHTHQARSLERRQGVGRYFNSGTWATLMHLSSAQLQSADTFKAVFQRMASAPSLPALGDLVQLRPTVVAILKGADGTTGATLSMVVKENEGIRLQALES